MQGRTWDSLNMFIVYTEFYREHVMPGPNQMTPSRLPTEGLPLYSCQKCRRMYYTGLMLYRFLRRKLFLQSRFIPLYTELSSVNIANSRGFLIN